MFEEIRIRDLGVIEEAEFALSPGLTVVTGETGAGKTMVVESLGLLLGGRADAGLVRSGATSAFVEGRVLLSPDHPAVRRAGEAGAELDDDGVLIVARTVSSNGRSRAHLGGRSVPVGVLVEMADDLAAVHGQSDQHLLRRASRQREALDRFAGDPVRTNAKAFSTAYERWRDVRQSLRELIEAARERAQRADLLRFGLDEVAAVAPEPGEDARLAVEADRLTHADALRTGAERARALVSGDEALDRLGVVGLLAEARAVLDQLRQLDPGLEPLAVRMAGLGYEAEDVVAELASYASSIEDDPGRLAVVQDRVAGLGRLTRKYGADLDAVLAWAESAAKELAALEGTDDLIGELTAEQQVLLDELGRLGAALTQARTRAAERLAAAVSVELAELAMPDAQLTVAVTQTAASDDQPGLAIGERQLAFTASGVDAVELLLRPHTGAEARPLHRGASGGELSRVMLAVEVVFAGADPVPTFVFDEVDAGVGGRAAVEVGARLARLARSAQVVVVTHLPQVAAFADAHLVVTKSSDGSVTRSGVTALDDAGRQVELARMLAGLDESESARAHALELLETAARTKST
jgi:DNA repair protein RecN (Recombination protein N)